MHPGLGHQLGRNLPVLLAMHLQLGSQLLGVRGRQAIEAGNPQLQQEFTALAADATDLAEMALSGSGLITKPSPAAEGAFLAITHQRRRPGALQVALEPHQALLELVLQASAKREGLPLKTTAIPSHHQTLGHFSLLVIGQEAPPEGQLEPVLAGDPAPLAGQHRPVGEMAPAADAPNPLQQGRVRLQLRPARAGTPEPQTHHPGGSGGAARLAMLRFLRQQGLKAPQLIVECQGAMGIPLTGLLVTKLIKPGPTPAAHPAAEQPVGEWRRAQGSAWNSPTLRPQRRG